MKNPHITKTLIQVMKSDKAVKLELIGLIIQGTTILNPFTDPTVLFDSLIDLYTSDLIAISRDLESDLESHGITRPNHININYN